ncbi:MAG: ECF transporter S component [Clostridia bacterium]|nr:ECF transporter S component [Clostridia bacterium]
MRRGKTFFIVSVGMFSALAFLLQYIGSLMGLKVAGFLEIEISDLPAIIASLAIGPVAGVCVEGIKNLLHCTISSTGFVGELANFVVNGTFVLVCGMVYKMNKTKKGAVISLISATVIMSVASIFTNLFIMLPLYMGSAPFEAKLNLTLYTIAPFNFVRGLSLSVITMVVYKKISNFIKR